MKGPYSKRILFLSGVDFKEKSIQVIRKTPEAYVEAGWEVHYVVGRDNSKLGDYFYENVVNPQGVQVYRFHVPLSKLHGMINNPIWKAFWFRLRNLVLVCKLVIKGIELLRSNNFQVIYGYEIPGVLAGKIIKILGYGKECKFISRFQGVLYIKEWLRTGKKFRLITNFEAIMALRTASDLCIMTNDGSQGVDVLRKLNSPVKDILFVSNGVDKFNYDQTILNEVKRRYYYNPDFCYLISVSRLDNHKRIDRGINIIYHLVNKLGFKKLLYTVIGGGADFDKLQNLVNSLGLTEHVRFLGPIKHDLVKYHYYLSDFFISMYTSTNVGNPLLEAIRSNNVIVTLNNGDTGDWIKHKHNGLIYSIDDERDLGKADYDRIANDILHVHSNMILKGQLKKGLYETDREKLWTWDERLQSEVKKVETLIHT